MSIRKIQLTLSVLFLVCYMGILGSIFYVEVSDDLNMKAGENSMRGELQILLGVLTSGLVQILNFWFKEFRPLARKTRPGE